MLTRAELRITVPQPLTVDIYGSTNPMKRKRKKKVSTGVSGVAGLPPLAIPQQAKAVKCVYAVVYVYVYICICVCVAFYSAVQRCICHCHLGGRGEGLAQLHEQHEKQNWQFFFFFLSLSFVINSPRLLNTSGHLMNPYSSLAKY